MNNSIGDFDWDVGEDGTGEFEEPFVSPDTDQKQEKVPVQKIETEALPNPDKQLEKMHNTVKPDYDAGSAEGNARQARTVDVNRRGRTADEAQRAESGSRDSQKQQGKQQQKPKQKPKQQQARQQGVRRQVQVQDMLSDEVNPARVSKKSGLGVKAILSVVAVVAVVIGVVMFMKSQRDSPVSINYKGSGKETLDKLESALNEYDATKIDAIVGSEDGDSYIAQEWAYVNGVSIREEFIKKICGMVSFTYPMIQQKTEKGNVVPDSKVDSLMNDGEEFTVTIPDYEAVCKKIDEDKDFVSQLLYSAGYKDTDYTYNDDMVNLMLQYLVDKAEIPSTTAKLSLKVKGGVVEDDSELDKLLFSSDGLHNVCAKFAQLSTGWTGTKTETYWGKKEVENPEYKKWYKLFNKYYEQDNGKFHKGVSKWEPWYLRDKNNKFIRDRKGNKIVNYYSVKDKNGKDWIEPDKTILKKVKKKRQVEDPWVEERAIPYNWIGTYYLANEYNGKYDTAFRVGDGTKDAPAGIGTTIITKMLCTDNKYHDVKVALVGYWVGENAIKYTEKFSPKNRGFTTVSPIQLIVYEIQIENLESKTITFNPSEMTLCDDNSNISSRTGTVYGFSGRTKIKPHQKVIVNDWSSSTELEQKFVCWGKSFAKNYKTVYFAALAGGGVEVPPYSAYKAFTGKSNIDEELETDGAGVTKDGTGESAGSTAVDTAAPTGN